MIGVPGCVKAAAIDSISAKGAEANTSESEHFMITNITYRDQIATVTLKTSKPLNSFDMAGFSALRQVFDDLAQDDEVRAIILTGEGRAFSAGAALDAFVTDGKVDLSEADFRGHFDHHLNPLLHTIMALPKPLVIAINGIVAGGGMGLALAGDIVIASEEATFYCGFVKMLAIVPDLGISWLLPNLMGRNKSLPFALLGDGITAKEASDTGMIFRAVPDDDLMQTAYGYAARLKTAPAGALRQTRMLFTNAPSTSYSDMLDLERDANSALVAKPEFSEGVTAFLEGREPDFADAKRKGNAQGGST